MARGKTFKFGKTLVNISSRGVATKDTSTGEIKRHAFPWTKAPAPAQPEAEQPGYEEEAEGQEPYYDEREESGYYDSGAYPGEEYPDGEYDDAQDDYDEEGEYGEEDEEERAKPAGLLGSSWFMWLMLIVLPPLGIWLLWRHNRYEITPRSAISAAAVVWFIIILIWLFSHLGGRDSTVVNPPAGTPNPTSTVETEVTPSPTPDVSATDAGQTVNAPVSTDASNVNIPVNNDGTGAGNNGTGTGTGTDGANTGNDGAGTGNDGAGTGTDGANTGNDGTPSATDDVSAQPSPTPNTDGVVTATSGPTTPDLANATFVYSAVGGTYYHSYATCSNMTNAQRVVLSVALGRGQKACPYCWAQASATPAPTNTPLPAGMYYYRPDGTYYHLDPNCQGMKSAVLVSEAEAIAAGKISCPVCLGSVYMTDTGTWYHSDSTCQGMKNAKKVTVTEARAAGKTECPVCMNGTPTTGTNTATGTTAFYATDTGKWYHSDPTCQGMTNAKQISAAAAEQAGKTACPVCLRGNSGTATYYATTGGQWYHTDRTCQGMTNAARVTLATALSRGQTACPVCAGGTVTTNTKNNNTKTNNVVTVNTGTANTTTNTKNSDSTYYSTVDGKYFHKDATCSGMKNATAVSSREIAQRGQQPCPKCIGTSGIYYSTATGSYYHSDPTCTGMKGATIVTLAMIRSRGQTACPKCIGGASGTTGEPNGDYWATATGEHYHKDQNCSHMKNAVRVTKATAEARGQTPCPTCIGSVYSAGGQYYHKDPTCQGMRHAELITIQAAEKAGQTACPVCIGGGATPTPTPKPSDDSNLSYYATDDGAFYHRTATCSGMKGATKVSEATAKARGQAPCPVCIGTVYATENGDYYHSDPNCTGMKGAKLMTVDQAELSGKSPCPTCLGGTPIEGAKPNGSTDDGAATADGATEVWVSVEGAKYHSTSTCSDLNSATAGKARLDWAVKNGYTRCTTCDAPALKN